MRRNDAFDVFFEGKLHEKLTDMHQDPVKAGRVLRAMDWRGSSARWSEERKSIGVPIGWVDVAE